MMSDNSQPAQVGADNPNIVLCVRPKGGLRAYWTCALCHNIDVAIDPGDLYGRLLNHPSGGVICRTCLAQCAPTLHALLNPLFPGKIVSQTLAHHTEFGDGTIRTMQFKIDRFDARFKNGEYRIKAVGQLIDEENG